MNVVDSCGWLEYIADGKNAGFFDSALSDLPRLIVPAITIYEVYRRLLVERDKSFADRALAAIKQGQLVQLDAGGLSLAALAAMRYKLAMAEAIIWQTAQQHGATLYTQDIDLKKLPGVKYRAKAG